MINVTKTTLPDLNTYVDYLRKIWENGWITNHGELSCELESKLKEYLGVKNILLVNNGTIALQIAIKALGLSGEIITTPFSYVATTASIIWENCKPVFCDIHPEKLTVDINNLEALITPQTTGLLFTHVFGFPCDVESITKIANKRRLKLIYDSAHSFGVKYKGESILNFGDISILSFHATKLFHTAEGGALITNDSDLAEKISYMRNFGHKGQEDFYGLGINGKISELHAAMGLCLLPLINENKLKRKKMFNIYNDLLFGEFNELFKPVMPEYTDYNYSYFPVVFRNTEILLKVKHELENNEIYPRRYFYPSLNSLNYLEKVRMPVSDDISSRILCLPLYDNLTAEETIKISKIILQNI